MIQTTDWAETAVFQHWPFRSCHFLRKDIQGAEVSEFFPNRMIQYIFQFLIALIRNNRLIGRNRINRLVTVCLNTVIDKTVQFSLALREGVGHILFGQRRLFIKLFIQFVQHLFRIIKPISPADSHTDVSSAVTVFGLRRCFHQLYDRIDSLIVKNNKCTCRKHAPFTV